MQCAPFHQIVQMSISQDASYVSIRAKAQNAGFCEIIREQCCTSINEYTSVNNMAYKHELIKTEHTRTILSHNFISYSLSISQRENSDISAFHLFEVKCT